MTKTLTYIEIDIPTCANTYGSAPCTASVPTTGPIKCFNCIKTCQDRTHFIEADATLRFAMPASYLPHSIEAIPSIVNLSFTPAIISLGVDLGQRATLEITFEDHPDTDTGGVISGFDKYLSGRTYDPFSQGTFWGKFRARQPYLFGRNLRWIMGKLGDALGSMETRHFVIDSFDGPTPQGKYTITATDVLRLAAGDVAQAPVMSQGFLVADMGTGDTSFTITPTGIGATYAASGYLNIGGNELVSFTRAADVFTIVRAQKNTVAVTHKAQDRVQTVLSYSGADAADILKDLLVTYAGVPSGYINIAAWRAETAAYLGNVYTADICEPTPVNQLASELILQAALAVWWDELTPQLRLQVLRAIVTDAATFTPDNTLTGTLSTREQPEQRISRVQTYFGQINPLAPLSNLDNFRSSSVVIDAAAETDYGAVSLKTIQSRWIPQAGRTVADRLGAVQIGRFRDPPRHVSFQVMRYASTDAVLGGGYQVQSKFIQDATGAPAGIPIQVTQLNPAADVFTVDAEEMLFSAPAADLSSRHVTIDANNYNINLRAAHDSIFPAPTTGITVTFTVNAGVVIGSTNTGFPAVDVGTWPAGVTVNLVLLGRIQGKGGVGGAGDGGFGGGAGGGGGTALYTRQAIGLSMAAGAIWGGGGGGGGGVGGTVSSLSLNNYGLGGGGGGGSGQDPEFGGLGGSERIFSDGVPPGATGAAGTVTAGGAGGAGGNAHRGGGSQPQPGGAGGGPGLAGTHGGGTIDFGAGGAAGDAIDGISHVTITASGDLRGPTIN